MLVSYTWLNTFFEGTLPPPEEVERLLNFYAWEIEGVTEKDGDHIIDVGVLPDTAPWGLSHRGVAKNLSVILSTPLARDPLAQEPSFSVGSGNITVDLKSDHCRRFTAARIEGVKVGPSPEWLARRLESLGQKSINNVVDATNYVMFDMGQPLHAFDADKLGGKKDDHIVVRPAKDGETITTLTGDTYELTADDLLIVDGVADIPVGIAGIKGGAAAEVDENTTNILIEAANFDPVSVRKTSQRLKLRTDASQRFEHAIVPDLPVYAQSDAIALITDIAGGTLTGFVDIYPAPREVHTVTVTREHINSLLGVSLTMSDITAILDRFGYQYTHTDDAVTLTPPRERPDLVIAEDVIEEIGRIYGYEHVVSVAPTPTPHEEYNKRFYYSEEVRSALLDHGFSEIYTSSFRQKDTVKLKNALASDKGYVRSALRENMHEALERNRTNADLLGLREIRAFEIGTVFTEAVVPEGEHVSLALGVRSPGGYTAKHDDQILKDVLTKIADMLKMDDKTITCRDGIAELNIDASIQDLPDPHAYRPFEKKEDITYQPFSPYPFVTRDIALWTEGVTAEEVELCIKENGGELLQRITLFDTFEKDTKTSYAFRIVFQSYKKTLTDSEVNGVMEQVQDAVTQKGWEVR